MYIIKSHNHIYLWYLWLLTMLYMAYGYIHNTHMYLYNVKKWEYSSIYSNNNSCTPTHSKKFQYVINSYSKMIFLSNFRRNLDCISFITLIRICWYVMLTILWHHKFKYVTHLTFNMVFCKKIFNWWWMILPTLKTDLGLIWNRGYYGGIR